MRIRRLGARQSIGLLVAGLILCVVVGRMLWLKDRIQDLHELIIDVAFRPDSDVVLVSTETHVYTWNIQNGEIAPMNLDPAFSTVGTNAFDPGGSYIFAARLDGAFTVWDLRTEVQVSENTRVQSPGILTAAWSRDTSTVATVLGQVVTIWDVSAPQARSTHTVSGSRTAYDEFVVKSVAWSPQGDRFVTGDQLEIRLWDTRTGMLLSHVAPAKGGDSVAWNRAGTLIAEGPALWQVNGTNLTPGRVLTKLNEKIFSSVTRFSPDDRLLAVATGSIGNSVSSGIEDPVIYVWRVGDGKLLQRFTGHDDIVTSLAFSDDGHSLVSGSRDGTVRLWTLR